MAISLSVTNFTDYRAFLIAHAQERKVKVPRWTYGSWAKRLNLKATSSLTKVIHGQRNPGPDITEKLVAYFRFSPSEADYFRDLVQLHKVKKDPRLAVVLMERLQKDSSSNGISFIDEKTFSVISEWYCYAVREMVRLDHFFENPNWIAAKLRFKTSPRQIRKAVDDLLSVGLLQRNSRGRLEIREARIDTSHDVASEAIKRNHEQTLENAKLAIRNVEIGLREMTGATMVMSTDSVPAAKEAIRRFRRKFAQTFEVNRGNAVYQIHVSLFPLTRVHKAEEAPRAATHPVH